MKLKSILFVIIFVLLINIIFTGSIMAEEPPEIHFRETGITAGANLATFRDASTGVNIFAGFSFPVSGDLLLTPQYELYVAEGLWLNGITADFRYDVARVVGDEIDILSFFTKGTIGYYFGDFEDEAISGLGLKAGVGADAELFAGLGVTGNVSFRGLDFEDANINLTGIEVGLGVYYDF